MKRLTPAKKIDIKARALKLEAEIATLQEQLGKDVDAEKIVKRHIKLLHRYNEAKDAAQVLMGRIASIRQVTVREIHDEFGLTSDD